jgi:protein O-mannosyl-transferase
LAVIAVSTMIAFSPVLLAGYIRFDDHRHILENPNLQPTSLAGLGAFWSSSYFGLYIPVTYSVWWVLGAGAHVFGATLAQSAWLFHALNLAMHLGSGVMVFWLVRTLLERTDPESANPGQQRFIALVAALLFALHPVQVESVAWIAECKGVLATLLGLGGMLCYYRSTRKTLAAVLFVAAMLAKPSALVFPGILVLINRVVLGENWKTSVVAPSLLGLLLVPFALATKVLQPDLNMEFVPTLGQRLLVAADALTFYARKVLVPWSLALDYGRSPRVILGHLQGWQVALSAVVAFAGVAVAAVASLRPRAPRVWVGFVSCGVCVIGLALAPVLGLVPFEFQDFSTVADHYLYLPMLGASLIAVGVLVRLQQARFVRAATVAVLVLLAGASFAQATRWRSNATVFAHTLTVNPTSYLAHYSLAAELIDTGRLEQGITEDLRALAINPDYLHAQVALGVAWIQKGNFQNAIEHYASVLAKNPSIAGKRAPLVASMHNNLGMALHQVGRHAEGTQQFREAVAADPQSLSGHSNLASAAFNEGRYLDAAIEYERALALSPGNRELEAELARARRAVRQGLGPRPASP